MPPYYFEAEDLVNICNSIYVPETAIEAYLTKWPECANLIIGI